MREKLLEISILRDDDCIRLAGLQKDVAILRIPETDIPNRQRSDPERIGEPTRYLRRKLGVYPEDQVSIG